MSVIKKRVSTKKPRNLKKKIVDIVFGGLGYSVLAIVILLTWVAVFEQMVKSSSRESHAVIHETLYNLDLSTAFFVDNAEFLFYSFLVSLPLGYVITILIGAVYGLVSSLLFGEIKTGEMRTLFTVVIFGYIFYAVGKIMETIDDGFTPFNIFMTITVVVALWRFYTMVKPIWDEVTQKQKRL